MSVDDTDTRLGTIGCIYTHTMSGEDMDFRYCI